MELQPGETKDVSFTLDRRAFAFWNTQIHDWYVESGVFSVEIGYSSRDIALQAKVEVRSTTEIPRHYTMDSIFLDLLADPRAKTVLKPLLDSLRAVFAPAPEEETTEAAREAISDEMSLAMLNYMPLRGILSFGGDEKTAELLEQILKELNQN